MKITRDQIINLIFLVAAAVILFTPAGLPVKVFMNRLISFSPDVIGQKDREILEDYNWKLMTPNQESYDFNQNRGKVTLVNLWATWCPPCIAEMPALNDLYLTYGDKVEFMFVTNDDPTKVSGFLEKNNYRTLPVYFERSKAPEKLFSASIPATYLIDSSGEIIMKEKGAAKWNSNFVKEVLDSLTGR